MKLFDRGDVAQKRRVGRNLFLVAAGSAMFASGVGMWTFFDDLDKFPWYVILPMFLLFDSAAIACAWMARINRVTYGRMGVEGWLVWLFAVASGLMSASDADGRAAAVRFAAPVVAAILFELLIRGERHDLTDHDGPLARLRRRALARLGLLDDVDQDDESAATSRMAAKLADAAHRVNTTGSDRARRRATKRYHRLLRRASVRMDFANNPELIALVRRNLDFLYQSVSATAPDAVAGLNVWQASTRNLLATPGAGVAQAATRNQLETPARVRIAPARRPERHRWLAGHRKPSTALTAPATPQPVPVPAAPKPAAAALAAPPAVQTTSKTIQRDKKKPRGRAAAAKNQRIEAQAQAYWQQNPNASARELASRFGLSPSTASRRINEWKGTVSA